MAWLYAGLSYIVLQTLLAVALRNSPELRPVAGSLALIVAALTPVVVIFRRRTEWSGCQQVFWNTIAAGAFAWGVGQIGWMVHEVFRKGPLPWLQWYALLNLVGSAAPLLALHARPHRGPRRIDAAIVAIDIAGFAVIAAFLYLFFVIGPGNVEPAPSGPPSLLLNVSQGQRLLLLAGMMIFAFRARGSAWQQTFRTLTMATLIGFAGRIVINEAINRNVYYTGSPFDLGWSLPLLMYAWAAATSPASPPVHETDEESRFSSPPWLIVAVVATVPATEVIIGRRSHPTLELETFRETVSNITLFALLLLLAIRVGVERAARHRTNARLRLMAAAVQQTDDLTLILRHDCRFEYANTAFCRAVGYTTAELQRTPAETLVAAESQQTFAEIVARVRSGGIARGTLTRVNQAGTTFVTSVTVVPLTNGRGDLTHLVSVERDITDELKRRDQLVHAERLSAVGELASGVAHEINNPLQAILGFTEIMLGTEQRIEARRDLQRIFTEANRAGKIVRNLLSFVRRSSHARKQDDLNDIVQSTVSLRAYELRVGGIELVENYDETLPAVSVNREEVQQVILNLILNAEHAMLDARGRGRLAISTGRAGDMLYADVEDDGPGVPPALAGQIFEPFFTTKGVGKGTGLGLSIGMGIAASHGGRLELLPRAGGGARFRLTVPIAEHRAAAAGAPREEEAAVPSTAQALVVDDEPAVRDLVARLLQHRGFDVDTASDGHAGLELARKGEYDLMLCDVRMPRMQGVEVFSALARVAPALQERFIFITGDVVAPDIAEIAADRQIPLLAKPFTLADLDSVISAVWPKPGDRPAVH